MQNNFTFMIKNLLLSFLHSINLQTENHSCTIHIHMHIYLNVDLDFFLLGYPFLLRVQQLEKYN